MWRELGRLLRGIAILLFSAWTLTLNLGPRRADAAIVGGCFDDTGTLPPTFKSFPDTLSSQIETALATKLPRLSRYQRTSMQGMASKYRLHVYHLAAHYCRLGFDMGVRQMRRLASKQDDVIRNSSCTSTTFAAATTSPG